MSTSSGDISARAIDLRFVRTGGDLFLRLVLSDGRRHESPIGFYPTLERARPADRNRWEWIGRGVGVHWPSLDLDLSVEGILRGRREAVPVRALASVPSRRSKTRTVPAAFRRPGPARSNRLD